MKLKYRDFVGSYIKEAIDRIIAIRPAPFSDISHSLVINIRRINAKIEDFSEAKKTIATGHEKKTLQYKVVLFFVPENADLENMVSAAGDKARLRRVIVKQKEKEDGIEIFQLDWAPLEELEKLIATDVFESIDTESIGVPTKPVLIDGMWNFVVIQDSEERGWIFSKSREEFKQDIDELMDTEIDIEIRTITNAMIKTSEDKRPGFVIPTDDRLIAWFMFEQDTE